MEEEEEEGGGILLPPICSWCFWRPARKVVCVRATALEEESTLQSLSEVKFDWLHLSPRPVLASPPLSDVLECWKDEGESVLPEDVVRDSLCIALLLGRGWASALTNSSIPASPLASTVASLATRDDTLPPPVFCFFVFTREVSSSWSLSSSSSSSIDVSFKWAACSIGVMAECGYLAWDRVTTCRMGSSRLLLLLSSLPNNSPGAEDESSADCWPVVTVLLVLVLLEDASPPSLEGSRTSANTTDFATSSAPGRHSNQLIASLEEIPLPILFNSKHTLSFPKHFETPFADGFDVRLAYDLYSCRIRRSFSKNRNIYNKHAADLENTLLCEVPPLTSVLVLLLVAVLLREAALLAGAEVVLEPQTGPPPRIRFTSRSNTLPSEETLLFLFFNLEIISSLPICFLFNFLAYTLFINFFAAASGDSSLMKIHFAMSSKREAAGRRGTVLVDPAASLARETWAWKWRTPAFRIEALAAADDDDDVNGSTSLAVADMLPLISFADESSTAEELTITPGCLEGSGE
jgi:hypothetical protein